MNTYLNQLDPTVIKLGTVVLACIVAGLTGFTLLHALKIWGSDGLNSPRVVIGGMEVFGAVLVATAFARSLVIADLNVESGSPGRSVDNPFIWLGTFVAYLLFSGIFYVLLMAKKK